MSVQREGAPRAARESSLNVRQSHNVPWWIALMGLARRGDWVLVTKCQSVRRRAAEAKT